MPKYYSMNIKSWSIAFSLCLTAVIIAACGGRAEPTATPTMAPTVAPTAAPIATEAVAEPASAPESPLAQPESPLEQPESPLTVAATPVPDWPRSEEAALAVAEQTTPPVPQEGAGSIGGVIYSYGIREAVPGTQFYLTPADEVDGEFVPPEIYFGPRPEMGDVVGQTSMTGQIQLDNVPPGNYYLMLWTVYNWLSVYPSRENSAPLLITVEPGDQLDLGLLYVNWP